MNRRYLIKSILGLTVAPKILAEIDFNPPMAAATTSNLFKDLNIMIPDYMPRLLEKYGSTSWALTADQFESTWNKAQLSYIDKLQNNGTETENS